jgi:hypothetical protein
MVFVREPMDVLTPGIDGEAIEKIADFCNHYDFNTDLLLDTAVTLNLVQLLYDDEKAEINWELYNDCLYYANKLGDFLMEQCTDDRQRFLGIVILVKSMIESARRAGL